MRTSTFFALPSPAACTRAVGAWGLSLCLLASCANQAQAREQSLWTEGSSAASARTPSSTSLAPLIKALQPSVVSIRVGTTREVPGDFLNPFMRPERGDSQPREGELPPGATRPRFSGLGSGFIIHKDGFVVTNHHVVDGHDAVQVKLHDGRSFSAKVVGSDEATDLALLKIDGAKDLQVAALGASKNLEVGDFVIAVGNPMGLEQTVTTGIISGKGRGSLGLYRDSYVDFLQTDAAISPGNSGGPLFNLRGEVIGINAAVSGFGRGLGFAIPVDQVKRVIPDLKATGKVARGWLGISGYDIETAGFGEPAPQKNPTGAKVMDVYGETPAAKAGLQTGDVIVAIEDHQIKDFADLHSRVADYKPGTALAFKIERAGKPLTLKVTLGDRPKADKLRELQVQNLRKQSGADAGASGGLFKGKPAQLGVHVEPQTDGLLIQKVAPGSLAEDLGLRAGDLILEVNGAAVKSGEDVSRALSSSPKRARIKAKRGQETIESALEVR